MSERPDIDGHPKNAGSQQKNAGTLPLVACPRRGGECGWLRREASDFSPTRFWIGLSRGFLPLPQIAEKRLEQEKRLHKMK